MNKSTGCEARRTKLRTSDPRLPLMATQAAIEFDNALQGKKVDFVSARSLAVFLAESFQQPVAVGGATMALDTTTVDVVGQAISEAKWRDSIRTVQDVVEQAAEIARRMENAVPTTDEKNLERLRLFCIALGNRLIAYRASLQEYRPASPYRR